MNGEVDLQRLLARMSPELGPERWVMITDAAGLAVELEQEALGVFREKEGTTLLLNAARAEMAGLATEPCWRLITLSVHSDLQAVGFLAALLPELARAGISINVFSAHFHDHLLVLETQAEEALHILRVLQQRACEATSENSL